MDFEFSDEQEQLRDAVRRWVDKGFGFERRHALAKAGGFTREVLGELNELGLAGLVVPEAHGGLGFAAVEAMVVMEELGRGLVNAPYAQAALVAPMIAPSPAAVPKSTADTVAPARNAESVVRRPHTSMSHAATAYPGNCASVMTSVKPKDFTRSYPCAKRIDGIQMKAP